MVENLTGMQCIQDGLTLFFNPIVSAFNMEIGQMIVELLDGASTAMQLEFRSKIIVVFITYIARNSNVK